MVINMCKRLQPRRVHWRTFKWLAAILRRKYTGFLHNLYTSETSLSRHWISLPERPNCLYYVVFIMKYKLICMFVLSGTHIFFSKSSFSLLAEFYLFLCMCVLLGVMQYPPTSSRIHALVDSMYLTLYTCCPYLEEWCSELATIMHCYWIYIYYIGIINIPL